MDPAWCYLCRIDMSGADPRAAWGLDVWDDLEPFETRTGPMTLGQASYLRFLCEEFSEGFDASLNEGEAVVVIESLLNEPMSHRQSQTLAWLSERAGSPFEDTLTYGQARTQIRRLVALRGLRSA